MKWIIDVDDVLAELVNKWLRVYNRDFNDNLKKENIEDWNIGSFTKIDTMMFDYLEDPDLYDDIEPLPYALDAIQKIRTYPNTEIIYCTSSTVGHAGQKKLWLQRNGFWNYEDHYIETKSKHLIKADIMIDDGYHNISKFEGKLGLLFSQPWNEKYLNYTNRINNWYEFIYELNFYEGLLNK